MDGKILLASEEGYIFVIKAGPVHEVLAVNQIDEPIWASPAIAGGKIFIRGERACTPSKLPWKPDEQQDTTGTIRARHITPPNLILEPRFKRPATLMSAALTSYNFSLP